MVNNHVLRAFRFKTDIIAIKPTNLILRVYFSPFLIEEQAHPFSDQSYELLPVLEGQPSRAAKKNDIYLESISYSVNAMKQYTWILPVDSNLCQK